MKLRYSKSENTVAMCSKRDYWGNVKTKGGERTSLHSYIRDNLRVLGIYEPPTYKLVVFTDELVSWK